MNVLSVTNLTKKFGSFTAVDGISFTVEKGEVLGLLGPNGAGKTTTLQMILGVLSATSGTISYFGKDFSHHREEILERVNFSSTYTNLPWRLSVKENLYFISYLYTIAHRKERIEEIIALFQLEPILEKTIDSLSAGQITRVNLAKAFINNPDIVLLDEPTASLDPETAAYIREFLLKENREKQTTILITSHNMAEVETMCNRIIFINHGTIIANDTPEALTKTLHISHVSLLILKDIHRAESYCQKHNLSYTTEGKQIHITIDEKHIAALLQNLAIEKVTYNDISIETPTLEDYFLSAVGRRTENMEEVK